jgi:thioredoxin reductase (NADPH)
VPSENERSEYEVLGNTTSTGPAESNGVLAPRFQQMFPVLSQAEIDRVRRFGEVRRFADGEFLFQAGETVPGMYVILSGRIAIVPRDGLGQAIPVSAFAQLIGAPVEEMMEVVPGEVIAEIGQLSRPTGSERPRRPSRR